MVTTSFRFILRARGQPATAVRAPEEAAPARRRGAVAARAKRPPLPPEVPHPGEYRRRIVDVHGDHRAARRRIGPFEYERPGFPSVRCLVEPAVVAVAPELSRNRGVDHIGICRINDDLGDMLRFFQSGVRPGLPGVGRQVYSVADRNAVPRP